MTEFQTTLYFTLELTTQCIYNTYGGNVDDIQELLIKEIFPKALTPYSKYQHIRVKKDMWSVPPRMAVDTPYGKARSNELTNPTFELKTIKGKGPLTFEIGIDHRNAWDIEDDYKYLKPRKPKGLRGLIG